MTRAVYILTLVPASQQPSIYIVYKEHQLKVAQDQKTSEKMQVFVTFWGIIFIWCFS
jgi:hypothetical protein